MAGNQTKSLFSGASGRLTAAIEHAEVSDDTLERLSRPKSALKVSIPLRMDDGTRSAPSPGTACATTTPGDQRRAASASTRT